jgi:hypothetical protein
MGVVSLVLLPEPVKKEHSFEGSGSTEPVIFSISMVNNLKLKTNPIYERSHHKSIILSGSY